MKAKLLILAVVLCAFVLCSCSKEDKNKVVRGAEQTSQEQSKGKPEGAKQPEEQSTSSYEATKYLNKKIIDSNSANLTIRNDAERELDEFPHSAKSFGKLAKSIKKNRYEVTCPVVLDDEEKGTLDGSHRLFATQFLADKLLFIKNSCFIGFIRPSKKDVER